MVHKDPRLKCRQRQDGQMEKFTHATLGFKAGGSEKVKEALT